MRGEALRREQKVLADAQAQAQKSLAEARARIEAALAAERARPSLRARRRSGAKPPSGSSAGESRHEGSSQLGLRHLLLGASGLLGPACGCQAAEPEHAAGASTAAAHGDMRPSDPKTFAFQLLNFAILVGVLGYFGGRAINKALAARHEQMKKDLDEAVQARAAAEARLQAQERRLANLEKEVTALRTSIKEEALAEEKRLLQAAEEKSRRIQEETRFLMDQEVKQAEIRFRTEVAAEAVRIAEEVVRQRGHARGRRPPGPELHRRPRGRRQGGHRLLGGGQGKKATRRQKLASSTAARRPFPDGGRRRVAGRYARALFELGVREGKVRRASAASWTPWPTSTPPRAELRQTLENPVFKLSRAPGAAREAPAPPGAQPEVRNFALLLLERGRIAPLPAIARAYREMADAPWAGCGPR